jgi:hypothetical protein
MSMKDFNFQSHAKSKGCPTAWTAYIFLLERRTRDKAKNLGRGEWWGMGQTVMFIFWSLVGNFGGFGGK